MIEPARHTGSLWRGPTLAWGVLLLLFLVNLGSAYVPLGIGNVTTNLVIAAVMAFVLGVFLMDLQSSQRLVRIVAGAGLFWTILMFSLTFSDYLTR